MLKSDPGNCNPLSAMTIQLKKTSAQLFKAIGQKRMAPVGLLTVLSFTGMGWISIAAIAPQIAQAYTASVDVSVNRQIDETYESFLRRAEAVARAAAQRSFDRDILITDVAVTVIGQNDGAIAPILLLEVSRQSWRNRPDPQRWATYFPNTQSLLGFDRANVNTGTQPSGVPQLNTPRVIPTPPTPAPTIIEIPGTPVRIQRPGGATPATTPQTPNTATPSAPSAPPTTAPATPSTSPSTAPAATPAPSTPANQPTNQPAGSSTTPR